MRPWSYSRLTTYEECPAQYRYCYVEKLPGIEKDPSTGAGRGTRVHKSAEDFLTGAASTFDRELSQQSTLLHALKARGAIPEKRIGVADDWSDVGYDSPTVMLRGSQDVYIIENKEVTVYDWKTGKVYDSHKDQMDFYAVLASCIAPEAERIITKLVYVDLGITTPKEYPADHIPPLKVLLKTRIQNAEADTILPVRPGPHCTWCDYSKRKGGPCKH